MWSHEVDTDCSSGTHEEIGVAKDTNMPQPAGTEQELG